MVAATCLALFTFAAIAAVGAIVSAWQTYGADVSALRALRRTGFGELQLSWRIRAPDWSEATIYNLKPAGPVRAGFLAPDLPSNSAFRPSLAA